MKTLLRTAANRLRARRTVRGFGAFALVAGFLFVPLAGAAVLPAGKVLAFGCSGGFDGQCSPPTAAAGGVTAVSAGYYHSLALKRDGSVLAWGCGSSNSGQCDVPTEIATGGATAISAGHENSLALTSNGSVVAWGCEGNLNFGQCNVPAAAASGVVAVAAGSWHSLALKNASVLAWGCGTTISKAACTVPATAASGVTAIAAGFTHSLALKGNGSVVAWGCGNSDYGQCTVPVTAASGVTAIAGGYAHSLALKGDGSVVAWGCGSSANYGQCAVPAAAASAVKAIAAAAYHSLALKQDGSVVVWGCGPSGIFNVGQCTVPAAAASGVIAISAGVDQSLAVKALLDQTITVLVHAPSSATYAQSFNVSASSGSGASVEYTTVGGCTHTGARITMISGTAPCAVKYDQDGTATYNPAPQVVEFVTAQKAPQTISFGSLATRTFGDPDFSLSASASSGLAVSFSPSGNCTATGATLHLTGAGSCSVTASQPGNGNYSAAPSVERSFLIAKSNQAITFGALASKTYGNGDFPVSASASSGLPVSFVASGNCLVTGSTVHLTGAGSCQLAALQLGDSNYNPAASVSQTFPIAKASQAIAFGALANKTYGDADFAADASASSGLAVSFAATGSCTGGATVHITGAGSCTVMVSQPGDANYEAAAAVSQKLTIAKAIQTITFGALADKRLGEPDFTASATASSGLPVSFTAAGSCTVSSATVHVTGTGSCTVTASQGGDGNYEAAQQIAQTFSIAGTPLKPASKCVVPKVVGKRLAAAKRALVQKHCRAGKIRYAYSRKSAKGTVTSQNRKPGAAIAAGSKIDLVVSRGRRP